MSTTALAHSGSRESDATIDRNTAISANENVGKPTTNRRTIGYRIIKANATIDDVNMWALGFAIFLTLAAVYPLAYVTVEFGMFSNRNAYSEYTKTQKCLVELQRAKFDIYDTNRYFDVMDESSTFSITETGTWTGPADIKEYVDFVLSDLFNLHDLISDRMVDLISATDDECVVVTNVINKVRVDKKFNPQGKCFIAPSHSSMHYSVKEGFKVKSIAVFYYKPALKLLFGDHFNTNEVRDDVCNIIQSSCQETWKFNNLTMDTCRSKYDDLPASDEDAYVDGNSKGCRIIHSRFARINPDHCAHLSFEPEEDSKGRIKCQESIGQQFQDFFSKYELESFLKTAHEWGFDETMLKPCEYEDVPKALPKPAKSNKMKDSNPTLLMNDYEFQVYMCWILYVTMELAGLGMEYLVWRIMLAGNWCKKKQDYWKVAQFVFPLATATGLGLAVSGNSLALPVIVLSLWKVGFPETIMCYYMALYEKRNSNLERLADFLDGIGTAVHHSSAAMYTCMLVTHVLPANKYTLACPLPLVAQHWVVLLRYNHKNVYAVLVTAIEIWWEWTSFSIIEHVHEYHWMGGMATLAMLFAHWCYFIAGILCLFMKKDEAERRLSKVVGDNLDRFSFLAYERASSIGKDSTFAPPGQQGMTDAGQSVKYLMMSAARLVAEDDEEQDEEQAFEEEAGKSDKHLMMSAAPLVGEDEEQAVEGEDELTASTFAPPGQQAQGMSEAGKSDKHLMMSAAPLVGEDEEQAVEGEDELTASTFAPPGQQAQGMSDAGQSVKHLMMSAARLVVEDEEEEEQDEEQDEEEEAWQKFKHLMMSAARPMGEDEEQTVEGRDELNALM
eukprot:CAMPEP_0183742550 /NCGR_PEP_ID=MMETSP0737-20130205/64759_1 /TAXON_ID=385413 /ORGANISM="Thalassiosira miniscula, Strain CCMP1093" /LENGTH=840 /DNA_ID=CAMNT_0025978137 /DNA_START=297 /DNA_END=2819 /DNA_ORIENTATION=-